MDDRRNYYRILHVQPDAPSGVVRANYRALMQKLRLHPDLGGEHWNAVSLNRAYATLKDPERRAAYDQELLERYDIRRLSRGPLKGATGPVSSYQKDSTNQRNYYRILQVQVDAPQEVIEASYRAILAQGEVPVQLLEEAYSTLGDPNPRSVYDQSLVEEGQHLEAPRSEPESWVSQTAAESEPFYQPIISRYCAFCKTPYGSREALFAQSKCLECKSPLASPSEDFLVQARRAVNRTEKDEAIGFYTYWPGTLLGAQLLDLSPTGLLLQTLEAIETGDIIKIEAQRFAAIGEVVHSRREESVYMAGVQFRTVGFEEQQGTFFSARG